MSSVPPEVVEPIIKGFAAQLQSPIVYLMIGTVFGSILLPLLLAVLHFSTPQTRRTTVFMSLVVALSMAIALAIWSNYAMIHVILSPMDGLTPQYQVASGTFQMVTLIMVDIVLLFRLLVVYPPMTTPRPKLAFIVIPPILFKVFRIVVWIVAATKFMRMTRGIKKFDGSDTDAWAKLLTEQILGWVAIAVDNAFASVLFLWKLRGAVGRMPENGLVTNRSSDSITQRIRALFWIATTNFVFPVIINIVQIALNLRYRGSNHGAWLQCANIYVSVLCATFAAVWSSARMSTSQNTFVGRSNFSSAITMSRGPVGVTSYPRAPRRDTSEEEWFDKGHKAGASPIPLSVRVERSEETSV